MKGLSPLDRVGVVALMVAIAAVSFKLLVAQVAFGVASLAWLWTVIADRQRLAVPSFAWALGGYALLTLVSALASFDPATSLIDLKQLVLFLMVPVVMCFARGALAMRVLNVVIAVGSVAGLYGVVQYSMLGYDHLGNRPEGSLSHYMTYSGVIMLILSAAFARLLFFSTEVVWPAVAVPALAVALGATNTRGAWIGAAVAVAGLLAIKRPRLLWLAPVVAVVLFVVAPASIQTRVLSIADPADPSNRDRVQMIAMGREMIADHPWFGVGPEMVGVVYSRYLQPDPVHTYNPHLHNVPVQIAAERGLVALAAWLTFVAMTLVGLWRLLRLGQGVALAAAGLAAVFAMLAAGLFEYNFGDSEFLMLFLALITLPFAAASGAPLADSAAIQRHAA